MPPSKAALLICSIGNPGVTYASTYHSAGHAILQRVAHGLQYPDWQDDRELGGRTTRTPPAQEETHNWTLWQSPVLMNMSGRAVHNAYKAWSKTLADGEVGRLIVVHDEMEKPTGTVTFKTTQGLSAKGHNGLKSIIDVLGGSRTPFFRLGIGIGRPVSREPGVVSAYVMAKMTNGALHKMDAALPQVIKALEQAEKVKVKKGP
jgi:PTH1 family peptidyl-tRNA hydrolase